MVDASSSSPQIVRPAELARRLGVARRTVLSWAASGRIPEPIRITQRFIGWPATVADAIVAGACGGSNNGK